MPSYQTTGSRTAIYPGDNVAVVNDAAVDSGITTTQQLAIGPVGNQTSSTVVVTNSTDQTATAEYAPVDADASYEPLDAWTLDSDTAATHTLSLGFLRFTFQTAPTTGSLIVSR